MNRINWVVLFSEKHERRRYKRFQVFAVYSLRGVSRDYRRFGCQMKLFHRHKWKWHQRGTGVYKKGRQKIEMEVPGYLGKCECGAEMFFPDDTRLYPVKVEQNQR